VTVGSKYFRIGKASWTHLIFAASIGLSTAWCEPSAANRRWTGQKDATRGANCDAAMQLFSALEPQVRQKNSRELLVSDPPRLAPHYRTHLSDGWIGQRPNEKFLTEWQRKDRSSIVTCFQKQSFEGQAVLTPTDETKLRSEAPFNSSDMFIRISMPFLDQSGRHALVLYISSGVSIGGHAGAYYLEHKEHKWRLIGQNILWVS
jgi:hypothetical protein